MFIGRYVLIAALSSIIIACSADADPPSGDEGGSSSSSSSSSSGGSKSSRRGQQSSDDDQEETDGPSNDSPSDPSPSTPSTSKKANGAQCKESADCKSDFCVFRTGGSSLGMCTKTCDDNIDCDLGSKCTTLGDAPQKACVPE